MIVLVLCFVRRRKPGRSHRTFTLYHRSQLDRSLITELKYVRWLRPGLRLRARFFTHQSAPEIPPTNPEITRENQELLLSDLATPLVAIDN